MPKEENAPFFIQLLKEEFKNLYSVGGSQSFFDIGTKEMCGFQVSPSSTPPTSGNNYETIE